MSPRRRPRARGGDAQGIRRPALLVGAVGDDVVLVLGIVASSESAVAGVTRASDGAAGVVAVGAPAVATHKVTTGLRSSSAPWPTTLHVWLAS